MEEGSAAEQQLGLRQAEERLYRDHIYRPLKVRPPARLHAGPVRRRKSRFSSFPRRLCSGPQSTQTTSTYASSAPCTSRTSRGRTSTSRRRDTRKTSRWGRPTAAPAHRSAPSLRPRLIGRSGAAGKAGGERAAGAAPGLRRPPEGLGRLRAENGGAARHLPGGPAGAEGGGRQDGGDHPTPPPRCAGALRCRPSSFFFFLTECCVFPAKLARCGSTAQRSPSLPSEPATST